MVFTFSSFRALIRASAPVIISFAILSQYFLLCQVTSNITDAIRTKPCAQSNIRQQCHAGHYTNARQAQAPIMKHTSQKLILTYNPHSAFICRTYALSISYQGLAYNTLSGQLALWPQVKLFSRQPDIY